MLSETNTYLAEIVLSTTVGELPSDRDVERLINDQMDGELDETTGLGCISVRLIPRCKNCGAPTGQPHEHDAGCIDSDGFQPLPAAWQQGGEHHS